jgi:hypothetical protein
VARYDKYEPMGGGFRAPLAADWAGALATPVGVGLDASGRVVPGAGNTGVLGVVVIDGQVSPTGTRTNVKLAGNVVDVMTDGEIVDCTGLTAGTVYYAAAADGVVSTTNTGARVGATVAADRLVVRAAR